MKTTYLTGAMAALIACIAFAAPAHAAPDCSNYSDSVLMQWPDVDPVWEFCWRDADFSEPQPDGSGLELFDVHYNGHLVFARTHVPILNVEYGPGGCGCFRDWLDSPRRFDAVGLPCSNGYCETVTEPRTICDCAPDNSCDANPNNACNVDIGGFTGVAATKEPTRLTLTTQTSAGWYRYIMKWRFYLDGAIEPVFEFGATPNGCTDASHFHHGYYRFDFDIDGAADDRIFTEVAAQTGTDSDGDGVDDTIDNCRDTPNPDQIDGDGDRYGNLCDADLNNDDIVNTVDLGIMKSLFFSADAAADINSDGIVNVVDLGLLKNLFFTNPGPGGETTALVAIESEAAGYASADQRWIVQDAVTGRGYRIVAGGQDHKLVADTFDPVPFAKGDFWALRERASEIDDGVNFGGGCAAQLDDFVDGEGLDGEDVVFWYRLGTQHVGLDECFCGSRGPRLEPIGDWSAQ